MELSINPRRSMHKFIAGLFTVFTLTWLAACGSQDVAAPSDSNFTAEKAELTILLKAYRKAIDARDFEAVFDLSMPPKMSDYFTKEFGMSREVLRTETAKFMTQTFNQIDSLEYELDMDNSEWAQLKDGTIYAKFPTSVVMEIDEQTITTNDENITFKENGRWYLVRVSESEQEDMFKAAYPQFSDVKFKRMDMRLDDE